MRPKLLIALFAAAAFFCAFFAATGEASAAQADETVAVGTLTSASPASHGNVAEPGSYAAKFGAPLCDDRAASAYAAEPKPAPVDAGEVAATDECPAGVGALFKATADASQTQSDDLNRAPPVARDLAILPDTVDVPGVVLLVALGRDDAEDGARDGFGPQDNPPPRPIPWRG